VGLVSEALTNVSQVVQLDFLQNIIDVSWPSAFPFGAGGPSAYFAGDFSCFLGYSLDGENWTPLEATLLGTTGTVTCGGWFRQGFVPDGTPVWLLGGINQNPSSGPTGGAIVFSFNGGQDGGFLATLNPASDGGAISNISFDPISQSVYAIGSSFSLGSIRYVSQDGINWAGSPVSSLDLPGSVSPGVVRGDPTFNDDPARNTRYINIFQASRYQAYGTNGIVVETDGTNVLRNGAAIPFFGDISGDNIGSSTNQLQPTCCVSDGNAFFIVGGLAFVPPPPGATNPVALPSIAWSDDGGISWTLVTGVTSTGVSDTVIAIAAGGIASEGTAPPFVSRFLAAGFYPGTVQIGAIQMSFNGVNWRGLDLTVPVPGVGQGAEFVCGGWFKTGFTSSGTPTWLIAGLQQNTGVDIPFILFSLNGGVDGCFLASISAPSGTQAGVTAMSFDPGSNALYALLFVVPLSGGGFSYYAQYTSSDGQTWVPTGQTTSTFGADLLDRLNALLPGTASGSSSSPIGVGGVFGVLTGSNPVTDASQYDIFQAYAPTAYGIDSSGAPIVIAVTTSDFTGASTVTRNGVVIAVPIPFTNGIVSDGKLLFLLASSQIANPIAVSQDGGLTWFTAGPAGAGTIAAAGEGEGGNGGAGGGGLTVTDDFNRPDGPLGGNWLTPPPDWSYGVGFIVSGPHPLPPQPVIISGNVAAHNPIVTECGNAAIWQTGSFSNNQYAEVTLAALPTVPSSQISAALFLRYQLSTIPDPSLEASCTGLRDYYILVAVGSPPCYISILFFTTDPTLESVDFLNLAPGDTRLLFNDPSVVANVGDRLRFEANGTTLTGYVNGVKVIQVTDPHISGGHAGILTSAASLDDFAAGDL
jgi:hypothetical protein